MSRYNDIYYQTKKEVFMKKIVFLFLIVMLAIPAFSDTTVSGVKIVEKLTYSGQQYKLNGAGIRKKFVLKLYVGSLYTEKSIKNENDVLSGSTGSLIRLDIISKLITSELMSETIEEGFDKAMDGDTSSLQNLINEFRSVFSEEIVKGDQFTFISKPGKGVTAYKGKEELITIENDQFREVLFSIWLGSDPADAKLKKAMLKG
jgi:hypothetical protein